MEALILDPVFDGDRVVAERGRNAAGEQQILGEDAADADLAGDFQFIAVTVPTGTGVDFAGGGMGESTVEPMIFAAAAVWTADVHQSAAGEQSAAPGAEPVEALRLVELRRHRTVGGEPHQRDAPVVGFAEVHAAVGVDGEGESAAVVEVDDAHAAPFVVVEDGAAQRSDLTHGTDPGMHVLA